MIDFNIKKSKISCGKPTKTNSLNHGSIKQTRVVPALSEINKEFLRNLGFQL